MSVQKSTSVFWYLLPVFFGIIGGVITYFILRKSNSIKARNCLILGGIVTVITFIASLIFPEYSFDALIGELAFPILIGVVIGSALYNYLIKKINSRITVYIISITIPIAMWVFWNYIKYLQRV